LLLLPFFAASQQRNEHTIYLTKDSLRRDLEKHWRFHVGDSAVWATKLYNDSAWELANPGLYRKRKATKESQRFNGIGWLRLHIYADTGITNMPLAFRMTHYGASEVYFDGEKIDSTGVIKGKDSTEYLDPQLIPVTFIIKNAGDHVLAIRYANYHAERNERLFKKNMAGLHISLGDANSYIAFHHWQTIAFGAIFFFLFGLFLALSLLHLFLYLYIKDIRSNLYFSIFCFSFALLFLLAFLSRYTMAVSVGLWFGTIAVILTSIGCFSLSGFNNELFSTGKLRFKLIIALCIISPVLYFLKVELGLIFFVLIGVVMLESVVLTIRAIYKKVKGARIIGVGIIFFGFFFLFVLFLGAVFGDINLNDSTIAGKLFEIFAVMAILSMPASMSVYLAWNFAAINRDLKNQLQQVKMLSDKTLEQEREKQQMLETRQEELEREVALRTQEVTTQKLEIEKQHEELKVEKKKSDDLLLNILPEEIADELKEKGTSEAKYFDRVSVLFTDFVDFTKAGERMTPQELVYELDTCFKAFDEIISQHNVEKIKTIGDAYLAVCGLPAEDPDHALNIVRAAIKIRDFMAERKKQLNDKTFDIRIGIHSGSVVAGIVGVKKFAYDIWGDTVNTAARMEQNSETGKVNISQVTYELVKDQFDCTYRGEITAKNKGALSMYFVEKEILHI
jgi:class 3 adenylate cyclase